MRVCGIIPAAGASHRYSDAGGLRPKLDEDLGGKPVLQRTVEVFTKFDSPDFTVASIVVPGPRDDEAFDEFRQRHADRLGIMGATLCRGGATHRWESVREALAHAPADCELLAVHDAARPCVSFDLIERTLRAAARFGAAVPALDAGDTVKRVHEEQVSAEPQDRAAAILGLETPATRRQRFVRETVDRRGLVLAQTPQVFAAAVLRFAYDEVAGREDATGATDDASLVELLGPERVRTLARGAGFVEADGRVAVVEGEASNFKITRPPDLHLARAVLGVRGPDERPTHKRF